jgi:L-threonylcarbamoyladenylate synthase
MEILTKRQFYLRKSEMAREMKEGKIFVYPTDTIYGIGCNARIDDSVAKIRRIKMREAKPFSVIAPSIEWIAKNCFVDDEIRKWIERLPGKITLVLPVKNRGAISKEVYKDTHSLGVRIPRNWFANMVGEVGIPFVTTSVNITGERFMTSLEDMDMGIREEVDYIIDEGPLRGRPSRVISLTRGQEILR